MKGMPGPYLTTPSREPKCRPPSQTRTPTEGFKREEPHKAAPPAVLGRENYPWAFGHEPAIARTWNCWEWCWDCSLLKPRPAYADDRLNGALFDRLYFADDTLLITTSSYAANRLLKEIEEVSMQYGLRLNRGKCCFIAMNGNNQVRFHDGVKLQRKTEPVFSGHHLSQSMNIRREVKLKLQQIMQTWYKLSTFWRAAQCSMAWKIQVYDAITQSELLYGLENAHLTQSVQKKINAFQLKGPFQWAA